MYSGKNDQIIDLQYNFDNMYYVAIGAQSELIDSFKFEPGVRYDPTLRKKLDDAKIASNNLQLYHKSTKTDDANEKMRLQQQILKNDPDLRAKVNASEFDTSVTTQDLIAQKAEEYLQLLLLVEEHYKQINQVKQLNSLKHQAALRQLNRPTH